MLSSDQLIILHLKFDLVGLQFKHKSGNILIRHLGEIYPLFPDKSLGFFPYSLKLLTVIVRARHLFS